MGQDGLRIGLIGLGSMGRHHARVIRATPGMELVAVADPGGDRFGVAGPLPLLPDVEALIGAGIDAAVVAVPTIHHEEVALALARAGVHALVEKPIAHCSRAGRRVADAFAERDLVGAVGYVERCNPALRALRERLADIAQIGGFFHEIRTVKAILHQADHLVLHDTHRPMAVLSRCADARLLCLQADGGQGPDRPGVDAVLSAKRFKLFDDQRPRRVPAAAHPADDGLGDELHARDLRFPRAGRLFRNANLMGRQDVPRPRHKKIARQRDAREVETGLVHNGHRRIVEDGRRHVLGARKIHEAERSEERRVGKECRSRWSPYH